MLKLVLQCAAGHIHSEESKSPGDRCEKEEIAFQCDQDPAHWYFARAGYRRKQKCPAKGGKGGMKCKGKLSHRITKKCAKVLAFRIEVRRKQ